MNPFILFRYVHILAKKSLFVNRTFFADAGDIRGPAGPRDAESTFKSGE